jgi:hypothetical protein
VVTEEFIIPEVFNVCFVCDVVKLALNPIQKLKTSAGIKLMRIIKVFDPTGSMRIIKIFDIKLTVIISDACPNKFSLGDVLIILVTIKVHLQGLPLSSSVCRWTETQYQYIKSKCRYAMWETSTHLN